MNQHAARLGRRLAYALVAHRGSGFFDPARLAAIDTLPWRRYAKFGLGGMLLAIGALTGYQQLVGRVSREAGFKPRGPAKPPPLGGNFFTEFAPPGPAGTGRGSCCRDQKPRG